MSLSCRALALVLLCVAAVAHADAPSGVTLLDHYFDGLHTLRADFSQKLTDSHGRQIDQGAGTLVVSRPGKLRWELRPQGARDGAGGELMVADGKNVWFYDRDLAQVSVKPMDAGLSGTPAMLLSGAVDVRKNFTLSDAGAHEGLNWVSVAPKSSESDFRVARLGFAHGDLARMVLEDKLGQTATIIFEHAVRNGPVAAEEVSFTPPADADLIGTPVP
ncbi:MAG TPA: outer membrane lipoprotein chaperone LolA [Steroidobacteraceae bacterium]|jgi:outer membrane lipoprotein carrier protein|nr:outer membrane lipoprotein chaperone LolA [Steroidobacteraceae bacterium]